MTKARDLANIISGGFDATDIPNLDTAKITSGTLADARIPNLATSKITSGTFADARLPATALNSNVDLTTLNASHLTSGTVADARIPDLNASKITAGTIASARLGSGTASSSTFLRGDGTYASVGGGTYSVHATDEYNYYTQTGGVNSADYIDIAGGNYVSFTPTSTDDYILFNHYAGTYGGNNQGANTYLMMSTSSSIGSGDTKLNYMGKQAHGGASGAEFDVAAQTYLMPCTGLTVGTTYYVEQAGSANGVGNWWYLNYGYSNVAGTGRMHHVGMIHYKKS